MANLFGRNKLKEKAASISTDAVMPFIEIVKTWQNDYHHGTLKTDKETSREQAYNQDFFIRILGYKEKPAASWSFEPQATTEKGQRPDAVISYNGENISAVVELKGASVRLDHPQQREGNMSPVQQAFKYKTQYRRCPFVIVSNFYEFRLYQDNQLDYEIWTLDDLVRPDDDYLNFKSWYVLLKTDNFIAETGASRTEGLLSEVRIDQEEIGNKFYAQYKMARLELLRDLWKLNEEVRDDIDQGIEKAQKIIDRLVFVCFAEDRGLLPDNILLQVVEAAKHSAFGGSVWNAFKGFFDAIDTGSQKLEIPDGYNGGLFRSDAALNDLRISDGALLKVAALGKYDFAEDLSVNILGHIFEQSISDLEEIKNKVLDDKQIEYKATKKRKQDGIFYTPDYIVRYIVENSLGTYLREHEEKLKQEFGLKGDIQDKTYAKREKEAYGKYLEFLQDIKVLDPACGSGAFLVYVFDYLLAENQRVDQILGNTLFGAEDYVKGILQNNIYGVDLNEESVEITKLSLWLKTAQKGKQLATLDANIKCGNSLIDDHEVAGKKAFSWRNEFPEIFRGGGFDVVIGNPPYVNAIQIKKIYSPQEFSFLKSNYQTAVGAVDLYIYFFERGVSLLKDKGILSFISPNRYLSASYGKALREWLIYNYQLISLVDFSDKRVFSDASTYPVISFIKRTSTASECYTLTAGKLVEGSRSNLKEFSSDKLTSLNDCIIGFLLNDKIKITEKVFKQSQQLTAVGVINATSTAKEADDYSVLINENEHGLKLVNTGTIDSHMVLWGEQKLTKKGATYLHPYLDIENDLVSENRKRLYCSKKIIIAKIGLSCESYLDENGEYASIDTNAIHSFDDGYLPEYIQCWLSSKLFNYCFECLFDGLRMSGGYLLYSSPNLRNMPVKQIGLDDQAQFVFWFKDITAATAKLQTLQARFLNLIAIEYGNGSLPGKTISWWRFDFADFIKVFKVKLNMSQKDELIELWNSYQPQLLTIEAAINALEREIDQKVYELYNLTPDEIAIVDGIQCA